MNNETRHTPGPWFVGTASVTVPSPVGEKYIAIGNADETRSICRVSRLGMADEQDLPNAALISAAPDLLAACKTALEYFENCVMSCADTDEDVPEVMELRAAIEKAETDPLDDC